MGKMISLSQLRVGELAKVIMVNGGIGLRQKLALRGISEGTILRIVSNYGPITVDVNESTVSIGRGMAHKILVSRI
jgi:Fe2+ transport system protein FeoA